jgi:hypothetical protein
VDGCLLMLCKEHWSSLTTRCVPCAIEIDIGGVCKNFFFNDRDIYTVTCVNFHLRANLCKKSQQINLSKIINIFLFFYFFSFSRNLPL